jgi:hypothetical protein
MGKIKIVSTKSKDFARINLDVGVAYILTLSMFIEVINRVEMSCRRPAWKI